MCYAAQEKKYMLHWQLRTSLFWVHTFLFSTTMVNDFLNIFECQDIDHCGADTYCCAPVGDPVWSPSRLLWRVRHGVLSGKGMSWKLEPRNISRWKSFQGLFIFAVPWWNWVASMSLCLYFKAWVEVRIYWRFRLLFILEFSRTILVSPNPCMPSQASYFHHRFEMFFSTQVVEKCTSGATCFATERCQRWTDGGSSGNSLKQGLCP